MSRSSNPLLRDYTLIPFDEIEASHVVPGVSEILADARSAIEALSSETEAPSYQNTIERLDDVMERVKCRIAPVTHLLSVAETPELRAAFSEVLPEITEFWTRLTLDEPLWTRLRAFAETEEAAALEGIRERHLVTVLRDFRRAGADLSAEEQERLSTIRLELSQLQRRFSENVMDATKGYSLLLDDEARLDGVPEIDRDQARLKAEERGQEGWLLTLDYPSFEPIVKYATDRELRRELYTAYVTRCRTGEFSNVEIIERLLELRQDLAEVLGYADFPDYRLEDHMAKTGKAAFEFIEELTERTRACWERDLRELREHAPTLGMDELCPWDVAFVSDDLRRARYDIDDEITRPYFPLERVLEGLFEVAERVFGLTVRERTIEETWHPDVSFYDLMDEDGVLLGSFYADWHPRPDKREGAWMNDLETGGPRGGVFVPHLGIIAGNLTPPKGDRPSLLTHREVETVLHEFGHLLHHLTSQVPIAPMAGINVAWDFVELPSQIMENWAWEEEALPLLSGHFETGEPLPEELFDRLRRARRFMGGWNQMRQLSFGYLDLRLHLGRQEKKADGGVMEYVAELLALYAPSPLFAELHATPSFTHLFSGGYAAAYYSYLWSEVLEADAFGRFRREGVFNREVGRAFMESILSRGDSDEPEILFREFMGRDPDLQALLDRNLGPVSERPASDSTKSGKTRLSGA